MQYAPTAYGAIAACAGVGPTRTLLTRSANDKVITSRHGRQARTDEKPIWMDTCRLSPTAPPDGGLNKGRPAMMALRSAFLSRCPLTCGGMCLTSDQGEEARYEQSAEQHRNLPIHRPRRQHAPLGAPSPHHAAPPPLATMRCAAFATGLDALAAALQPLGLAPALRWTQVGVGSLLLLLGEPVGGVHIFAAAACRTQ